MSLRPCLFDFKGGAAYATFAPVLRQGKLRSTANQTRMEWPKGLPVPYMLAWPTIFYEVGSDQELHRENGLLSLPNGTGFIWGDGMRYRVVDSWLSFDHRGHFDLGMHVFLERVEEGGADDPLGRLAPDYFRVP